MDLTNRTATEREHHRFRRRNLLLSLSLALIAFTLYMPMLGADFVWDSRQQILIDTFLHDHRNFAAVLSLRVLSMDVLDFNRPVNLLSPMLDSLIWGKNPFGYHLTNVLLHVATAVLLFSVTVRLLAGSARAEWIAFAAALVFAVHPVNTEAVAEISYREDLLVEVFMLAGLACAAWRGPTRWWGAATVVLLFLAAASKESGVAGPVALLLLWMVFRRDEARRPWLWMVGASALAVGGFLVARFALEPQHSAIFWMRPPRLGGSVTDTFLIQPRIWTLYLRNIVWPDALCADYTAASLAPYGLGLSLAVLLAAGCAQVWLGSRNRVFAFGGMLCWVALLPVSNLIPIFRPIADRFLYLPMAGISMMLAGVLVFIPFRRFTMATLALASAGLAAVTLTREKYWHDSVALWTETSRANPESFSAADNLSDRLIAAGKFEEALPVAERAISLASGKLADPFALKALALDGLGRRSEADAALREAINLDPRYGDPDALVAALQSEAGNARALRVFAERVQARRSPRK